MSDPNNPQSTTTLISDAMNHVSTLVRKEVDLARAEISENLNKAGAAIGMLVAAAIIALTTLNVLAAALVAALTEAGIEAGWSSLIVGVVLGLVALFLAMKGKNDLSASSLAPTRTARNVKRDAYAVKDAYDDK